MPLKVQLFQHGDHLFSGASAVVQVRLPALKFNNDNGIKQCFSQLVQVAQGLPIIACTYTVRNAVLCGLAQPVNGLTTGQTYAAVVLNIENKLRHGLFQGFDFRQFRF
ncbi:Uncharacterised protein [Klebsiella pneumoniae subsp. rhinoscleromatis]|nr:Uncharacterised protein [Klebsiella pneumoniae]STU10689.1 Uncharacterised protein [Klebsiella pneumoniae]STV63695.1 Uncharacterised protein [Klebsiella pneumoniae subsp. rhinoscleromatis]STW03452.1 Uncharacterised protein [Klebsiella pneumoniae subsp. rhinoscleromatis]VTT33985.1 Uncharacterised protein [Klebsiella pneumoniae]